MGFRDHADHSSDPYGEGTSNMEGRGQADAIWKATLNVRSPSI